MIAQELESKLTILHGLHAVTQARRVDVDARTCHTSTLCNELTVKAVPSEFLSNIVLIINPSRVMFTIALQYPGFSDCTNFVVRHRAHVTRRRA